MREDRMFTQRLSLLIGDRAFLFENVSDTILYLYEQGVETYYPFISFLQRGRENGELCFYAYDNSSGNLRPEQAFKDDEGLCLFQMMKGTSREIDKFNEKIYEAVGKIPREYPAIRLIADFGGLVSSRHEREVLDFVGRVLKEKDRKVRSGRKWKRLAFRAITAFDADSLSEDAIRDLLAIHENAIFTSPNETTISFLGRPGDIDLSDMETVPKPDLEHFVKNHLETMSLALLLRRPMCGYDLIKTIHREYHTFLSQGTVYPLLYSLRDRGLLEIEESQDSRAKVYTLTEDGRGTAEDKIREFRKAQKYLLESMEKST